MTLFQSLAGLRDVPKRHVGVFYACSGVLYQASVLLTGFWVLRWIEPVSMGVWQTLIGIQSCALVVRAGVLNAFNLEYPSLVGRQMVEAAGKLASIAWGYTLAISTCTTVAFVIAAFWVAPCRRASVLAMAVVAGLDLIKGFCESTFRTGREFGKLASINVLLATVVTISTLLPAYLGFSGFLVRAILVALTSTLLLVYFSPIRVRPRFRSGEIVGCWRSGWPLFVSNYLLSLSASAPRLVLAGLYGAETVGIFSPVSGVISGAGLLAGTVAAYVMPKQTFELAQGKDRCRIISNAKRIAASTVVAGCAIAISAIPVFPVLISRLAPRYIDAAGACQIGAFAGALAGARVLYTVFASLREWRRMYYCLAVIVLSAAVFPALFSWWTFGERIISAATLGVLVGNLIGLIAIWKFANNARTG